MNALEGTWASVDIADHTARVRCKGEIDPARLREAVRSAGYVVMD